MTYGYETEIEEAGGETSRKGILQSVPFVDGKSLPNYEQATEGKYE